MSQVRCLFIFTVKTRSLSRVNQVGRGAITSCTIHLPTLMFFRKHMQRGKGGASVSNPGIKKKNSLFRGSPPERKLSLLKEASCFLCSSLQPHPRVSPLQHWGRSAADTSGAGGWMAPISRLHCQATQLLSGPADLISCRRFLRDPKHKPKQASLKAKASCSLTTWKGVTARDHTRLPPIL